MTQLVDEIINCNFPEALKIIEESDPKALQLRVNGNTLLHLVVQVTTKIPFDPLIDALIDALSSKGVDPSVKNNDGETAYMLAIRLGNASVTSIKMMPTNLHSLFAFDWSGSNRSLDTTFSNDLDDIFDSAEKFHAYFKPTCFINYIAFFERPQTYNYQGLKNKFIRAWLRHGRDVSKLTECLELIKSQHPTFLERCLMMIDVETDESIPLIDCILENYCKTSAQLSLESKQRIITYLRRISPERFNHCRAELQKGVIAFLFDKGETDRISELRPININKFRKLEEGPLPKNEYSYQLEYILKNILRFGPGVSYDVNKEELFISFNGERFNLSEILKNANFNHIQLNAEDQWLFMCHYLLPESKEMDSEEMDSEEMDLEESDSEEMDLEGTNWDKFDSTDCLSPAEFAAIHYYTGPKGYDHMNELLRGRIPSDLDKVSETLLYSALCTIGLNKFSIVHHTPGLQSYLRLETGSSYSYSSESVMTDRQVSLTYETPRTGHAFLSATKDEDGSWYDEDTEKNPNADYYRSHRDARRLLVRNAKAPNVKSISAIPANGEVIFPPGQFITHLVDDFGNDLDPPFVIEQPVNTPKGLSKSQLTQLSPEDQKRYQIESTDTKDSDQLLTDTTTLEKVQASSISCSQLNSLMKAFFLPSSRTHIIDYLRANIEKVRQVHRQFTDTFADIDDFSELGLRTTLKMHTFDNPTVRELLSDKESCKILLFISSLSEDEYALPDDLIAEIASPLFSGGNDFTGNSLTAYWRGIKDKNGIGLNRCILADILSNVLPASLFVSNNGHTDDCLPIDSRQVEMGVECYLAFSNNIRAILDEDFFSSITLEPKNQAEFHLSESYDPNKWEEYIQRFEQLAQDWNYNIDDSDSYFFSLHRPMDIIEGRLVLTPFFSHYNLDARHLQSVLSNNYGDFEDTFFQLLDIIKANPEKDDNHKITAIQLFNRLKLLEYEHYIQQLLRNALDASAEPEIEFSNFSSYNF